MSKFNLNDYDQVEDRIKKFYEDHTDGRITTEVIYEDGERTMIEAYIYLNKEDQINKCPKSTGIAEEIRIMNKSISKSGMEYEEVNFSSWTENCETSAIGRALANMNISGNKRPSRQEMEKVERYSNSNSINSRPTTAPRNGISEPMTKEQEKYVKTLIMRKLGIKTKEELPRLEKILGYKVDNMTKNETSDLIKKLLEDNNWVEQIIQNLEGPLD